MTESEWLASEDPLAMLDHLHEQDRTSRRKLVLVGVACCRSMWELIPEGEHRHAVEVAEAVADGAALASADAAFEAVRSWGEVAEYTVPMLLDSCRCNTDRTALACIRELILHCSYARLASDLPVDEGEAAFDLELHDHALRLHEIVGNPFRSSTLDPLWLAWNEGVVPNLARSIYDERAFDRLPILADALEDAGCTVTEILAHLRSPGPHARGCWALDLVLGRG